MSDFHKMGFAKDTFIFSGDNGLSDWKTSFKI